MDPSSWETIAIAYFSSTVNTVQIVPCRMIVCSM